MNVYQAGYPIQFIDLETGLNAIFFITIFHEISHEITSDKFSWENPWFSHGFPMVFPWSCSFWYAKSAAALRLFADAPETLSDAASGPRARAKESSWHRASKTTAFYRDFICVVFWDGNIYLYLIYIIYIYTIYIYIYIMLLHYFTLNYIVLY